MRLKTGFDALLGYLRHLTQAPLSKELYKTSLSDRILSTINDAILVTNQDLKIVEINPAFTRVTGYTKEEILGRSPSLLSSGRHDKEFYDNMWHSINESGQWTGTIWNRKKNGDIYPEWLSISTMVDSVGKTTHYLATFSDLSHQKSFQNQTHLLAYYDSLTGLPNRVLFNDRLNLSLSQARREMKTVALFFLDLDNFKSINDSLGHAIGDQVLRGVASRLGNSLRESDTVARLSGDEFCVILSGITSHSHAIEMAKKILGCFRHPIMVGQRELYVGTSIGISLYPEHGEDAETLLRHADSAMYRAKETDNNRYHIYNASLISKRERKVKLENDLCKALQEDQLKLAFHPQLDLSTGKITTIETLVRWQHQNRGEIPPNQFIPLADETGLILQLGNWVLDSACRQMAEWRKNTDLDIRIALNVSEQQLSSGRFPDRVARALQKSGLPSEALELEISESVLAKDHEDITKSLYKIKELGVQIAIDDFGIGYSSLCNIMHLSINKLKIDRSLIANLSSNNCDKQLVMTIINLAHNLYLTVCAGGVETREQLHVLKRLGCDQAQGHLFSEPITADKMAAVLQADTQKHGHIELLQTSIADS